MERMTKGEGMTPEEYIAKLEEENKKLKEKIEHLEFDIDAWKKLKAVWEKKEQKLQIEIGGLMGERDGLQMVVERLQKEIEEQEAEGHGLFDEIDYRKRECKKLNIKVASLEGEIKGLNYTIDKLREELSAYDREYFDEDKKAKNIHKD